MFSLGHAHTATTANEGALGLAASIGMEHRFGVAWYGPSDWRAVRDAAVDPDELEPSYDDWLRLSSVSCGELAADGIIVERIRVEAGDLIVWCERQGVPLDASARARFTAEKLASGGAPPQERSGERSSRDTRRVA